MSTKPDPVSEVMALAREFAREHALWANSGSYTPAEKAHAVYRALEAKVRELEKDAASGERMADALHKIKMWSQAYPLEVFPEPDLKRAHEVLTAAGMTLDGISAHAMRHVITRVQEIVDAAIDSARSQNPQNHSDDPTERHG